ncbi:hypothetical protein [Alkaliphilus sp. B6464]|uniref:hypothetical protein n=1 Tax=Alkaliphilus sp. B6464 TaxID=2731219 RepID=UPI001BA8BCCC|nr:hypothetical protein [Alkaliphilus sp. B6464]QUH21227.1 hypothetical protein HYG84_15945 [Alkaliphilus sp. B6464]
MNNIGFLEIVILIALIMYIYLFLKEFNRQEYLGRLILQVPRDFNTRASIFFWSLLGCFWIFLLISRLVNLSRYADMNPTMNLMIPVLWILLCIYRILQHINDKEIRENGITIIQGGIVYWKDIIDYRWLKDEKLEIVFQQNFRFALNKKVTKIWTINSEDKENIDMIFHRYLDIGK